MGADPSFTDLQVAIENYSAIERRWAYEQTTTEYNRHGEVRSVEVTRVDPSLPWDDRDVLIATEKGPASDRQMRKYQKEREKERRRNERNVDRRKRLRDRMNFPLAEVVNETADSRIYEVPLLPDEESGFPMDKIKLQVSLDATTAALQWIDVKLLEAVRHKAVAKVKNLALRIEFGQPPVEENNLALLNLRGQAAASVLFFPVGGEVEVRRKNHRWVTPYDDRFQVEYGPPTAIDF